MSFINQIRDSEDYWFPIIVVLVIALLIGRGVYLTRKAHTAYCPDKKQSVTINYLAIPLVQDAITCE